MIRADEKMVWYSVAIHTATGFNPICFRNSREWNRRISKEQKKARVLLSNHSDFYLVIFAFVHLVEGCTWKHEIFNTNADEKGRANGCFI